MSSILKIVNGEFNSIFRTFQSLVRNMTKNDSKEDKAEAGQETKKVRPDGQIED